MSVSNPLRSVHEGHDATFLAYGEGSVRADVVETFGALEAEYAAIRKGAALIDLPHRGTIEVAGGDRIEFLNRMVTQELKDLEPNEARRSFWLNRKGRIDADLRLIALADRLLMDCEVMSVQRTISGLEAYLFAEDVRIEDRTEAMHRMALHGPRAAGVLDSVTGAEALSLEPGRVAEAEVAGVPVVIDRQDSAGERGFEILTPTDGAEHVYNAILGASESVRCIGWHAYNIARIEAGTPIFGIDFGPTNLPHETGVLRDRVSFRKGCYLGQEVVARMESLGHPKQILVGLRVEDQREAPGPAQPQTGSALTLGEKTVGAVTSCTRSPMLGDAIIALAQVKWDAAKPGTELLVAFAGGGQSRAVVQEQLAFWRHGAAAGDTKA